MADIQQAALWIREGMDVRRPDRGWWLTAWYPQKESWDIAGDDHELNCDDLLADDWEIVQ